MHASRGNFQRGCSDGTLTRVAPCEKVFSPPDSCELSEIRGAIGQHVGDLTECGAQAVHQRHADVLMMTGTR